MRMVSMTLRAACLFGLQAIVAAGCGGSSPAGGATTPTVTVSPTPAASPNPVAAANACDRIGDGTVRAQCGKGSMAFFDAVDGAIDDLIRKRPGLFNTNDVAGERSYRVLDQDAYYQGLADTLGARGLCARMDATESFLQVKQSNDFSEDYEVLTTRGYTPRGVWIYRSTCTPASFPVAASETISYIRISFFGFNCSPGVTSPNRGDTKLPLGCDGYLTATPKDPDGRDVPSQIHGADITWSFKRGAEFVHLRQWPDQPFNQTVFPVAPGFFKICATVSGVSGCQGIEVIP
jgi:hypothetical protein